MKICPKRKEKSRTQPIRHTHRTAAALEDALAVAWDIIHEQERAIAYADSRSKRLIEILQLAREGPHAYNPDKPSGLRLVIRQR